MVRTIARMCVAAALFALAACAATGKMNSGPNISSETLQWSSPEKRVVLVRHFDLKAKWAGSRDDWNVTGSMLAASQLTELLAAKHIMLITADPATDADSPELSACISEVLFVLNSCAEVMRQRYGADYALFINADSTYDTVGSTAGKAAIVSLSVPVLVGEGLVCVVLIICPAALEASHYNAIDHLPAPSFEAPSSATSALFDLRTGTSVWSNHVDNTDWRDSGSAKKAAQKLLKGSPL